MTDVKYNSSELELIKEKGTGLMQAEMLWMHEFLLKSLVRQKEFIRRYKNMKLQIYTSRLERDGKSCTKEEFEDIKRLNHEEAAQQYAMVKDISHEMAKANLGELDERQYLEIAESFDLIPNEQEQATSIQEENEKGDKISGQKGAMMYVLEKVLKGEDYQIKDIIKAAGVSESTYHRKMRGDPPEWFHLKRWLMFLDAKDTGRIPDGEKNKNGDIEAW